ncbi:MAG: DVUA0089 family protein, partial [Planctomycetota bacterium]
TVTLRDPQFYKLLPTQNTVSSNDDAPEILPDTVTVEEFDADGLRVNRVRLTFPQDLHNFGADGALRLRVGSDTVLSGTPEFVDLQGADPADPADDIEPGDTIATAHDLGGIAVSRTFTLSSEIVDEGLPFDLIGSNLEPGQRNISDQNHFQQRGFNDLPGDGPTSFADGVAGITEYFYNFALERSYGTDAFGNPVFTTINPEQIQRVREIFDMYGDALGVTFVETVSQGTTVVVGDLFPLGGISSPGDTLGIGTRDLAILDGGENWYNGFGRSPSDQRPSFFESAMRELGHSIGLGPDFDLPVGSIMRTDFTAPGDDPLTINEYYPNRGDVEWVFPGNAPEIHGQHLYRPDNRDVDIFRFEIDPGQSGNVTLETFAVRRDGSSLLDTHLTLLTRNADGDIVRVAANDDAFGDDSRLTIELEAGEYFVAVTASGNENFNPNLGTSGDGATTEGKYDLRVSFESNQLNNITDAAGTILDGDGDGVAGGEFNFWLNTSAVADTLIVDNSAPVGGNGSIVSPFREIDQALAQAQPGDTVRIVGNPGEDGLIGSRADADGEFAGARDNLSYEIGRIDSLNRNLEDGRHLIVPQGVTVQIDAGSILKFSNSRITVGSGDSGIDASLGSLQILGTPHLPVFLTSFNDERVGRESSPLNLAPSPGNWGGIDIRNGTDRARGRLDLEREGIFTNFIAGVDLQYGGGAVLVDGRPEAISPIRLDAARPTIINNNLVNNAGSAISADTSSLEETQFSDLRYQRDGAFIPDYSRVGPTIYDNNIANNSINGLFVRVDTLPGGSPEKLVSTARFDDTEITYILGENIFVEGNPSALSVETQPADLSLTRLNSQVDVDGQVPATMPGDTGYQYTLSYVDEFGVESLPTEFTAGIQVALGDNAIRLRDLP